MNAQDVQKAGCGIFALGCLAVVGLPVIVLVVSWVLMALGVGE